MNHVKESIENDVGIAIRAYWNAFSKNKIGAGFFAIPRMLFPEIDGLGAFLTGKPYSTGLNIKIYLTKIMGQLDIRYEQYAGFIAVIYRHGLLHQHTPKRFKSKNREFEWWFSINSPNSPLDVQRKFHLVIKNNLLMIDMNVFYRDVLDSMDLVLEEILGNYRDQFVKVFKEQNRKFTRYGLLKGKDKKNYLTNGDFKFLEKINS